MSPFATALVDISKLLTVSAVGAALAYWFGLRGKTNEISLQRTKELNAILANMLTIWHYFAKLNQLTNLPPNQEKKMLFPMALLPVMVHQAAALNDEVFEELEKSVSNLKQYDPLAFHKLEGMGRRFAFMKDNFVAPLLSWESKQGDQTPNMMRRAMLEKISKEFEKGVVHVAQLISKKTARDVQVELDKKAPQATEELIDEYNREYYSIVTSMMPENVRPDYEAFKQMMGGAEVQGVMEQVAPLILRQGFGSFMTIINQNPSITPKELEAQMLSSLG
ncbi:hypothetical protein [Hymenobacter rigui]|uniref:Uncharacterized protein n=1 Tax=Hymenobacter rigui TaxID=334424 RepID=A0A428KGC1_9BACT|nr:hypothetical protein [Hymenobacter rigui]RSK45537.1 hypothetical protein EI291_18260 [Hymenobacter rigui]